MSKSTRIYHNWATIEKMCFGILENEIIFQQSNYDDYSSFVEVIVRVWYETRDLELFIEKLNFEFENFAANTNDIYEYEVEYYNYKYFCEIVNAFLIFKKHFKKHVATYALIEEDFVSYFDEIFKKILADSMYFKNSKVWNDSSYINMLAMIKQYLANPGRNIVDVVDLMHPFLSCTSDVLYQIKFEHIGDTMNCSNFNKLVDHICQPYIWTYYIMLLRDHMIEKFFIGKKDARKENIVLEYLDEERWRFNKAKNHIKSLRLLQTKKN